MWNNIISDKEDDNSKEQGIYDEDIKDQKVTNIHKQQYSTEKISENSGKKQLIKKKQFSDLKQKEKTNRFKNYNEHTNGLKYIRDNKNMNAVLQCLSNIEQLVYNFISKKKKITLSLHDALPIYFWN
mgnify:CR=1 FL=1